jgi:hypothetical protein
MKARTRRTRQTRRTRKQKRTLKRTRRQHKKRTYKQRGGAYMGFNPVKEEEQYTTVLDRELSDTPMLMRTKDYLAAEQSAELQ